MAVTIPAWVLWLLWAGWPWAFVVVAAWLHEPSGFMFDVDIWTPLAFVFAVAWTGAVLLTWVLR